MSTIKVEYLVKFLTNLYEKYNVDLGLRKVITNQILALRQIYGDEIPKKDIINVLSKQLAVASTGYKEEPVDIEEFLLSSAYLDLNYIIRPAILDFLIDLHRNNPDKYEVVIGGGTGLGKTFATCASMAYDLYKMSCLYSPQVQYKIAPGSEIVFSFQSVKKDKALRNFNEFKGMVTNSPYFMQKFPPKVMKDKIIFPYNIVVKVFTSTDTAAISENIFDAFIDEANWMKVIRGSKFAPEGSDIYDQATQLYLAIKDRIKNRFKDFKKGTLPGKIYLVSSANYENDFISKKEEEAKTNKSIYVFHKALWEVKPMELSGKVFWVRLPSESEEGKILLKEPDVKDNNIIEVPIEFLDSFEENLIDSIRNIAGVPIAKTIRFIPSDSIGYANTLYSALYKDKKFFKRDWIYAHQIINIEKILDIKFMELMNKFYKFGMHLDMSKSNDYMGLAIGCVPGVRKINLRKIIDPATETYKEIHDGELPIYTFPGILQVRPTKKDEIDMDSCLQAILIIKQYLPNLQWVSFDRAFSTSLMQSLKKRGIKTFIQSVDKTSEPYDEFRNAGVSKRLCFPDNKIVKEEIKYLIQDSITGKVDHDELHTKDVTDCLAATAYNLSKYPKVWCLDSKPKKLYLLMQQAREIEDVDNQKGVLERVKINRPTVARPTTRRN